MNLFYWSYDYTKYTHNFNEFWEDVNTISTIPHPSKIDIGIITTGSKIIY